MIGPLPAGFFFRPGVPNEQDVLHGVGVHELTDEERRRLTLQVEFFVDLVARKYDVAPTEVMDAVRYVKERREFMAKMKSTGMVSLIGLVISAIAMTMWEGIKAALGRGN